MRWIKKWFKYYIQNGKTALMVANENNKKSEIIQILIDAEIKLEIGNPDFSQCYLSK